MNCVVLARMTGQALCHPDRVRAARGLCNPCYQRFRKGKAPELQAIIDQYEAEKDKRIAERSHRQRKCANEKRRGDKWRAHTLWHRYSLTIEDYDRMLSEQGGACYICKEASPRRLEVDHCHKSGQVRRLLCTRCNTIVGIVESEKSRLFEAQRYVAEHAS
jgi:hypothetical protein